jgi:SAM-dependent methyltransferase
MEEGPKAYPRILRDLPIPPEAMRARVSHPDIEGYLRLSRADAQHLLAALAEAGFDPTRGGALLDYGCGSGRLLRMAARFAETCELHGCDVDAEAIAWCRANLPFARYETISPWPPTPYRDGRFDAVYAYSIFSHLPETLHRAWLEELHRILRPGAACVLTIQGRRVVERFLARQIDPRLDVPSRDQMRSGLRDLENRGFVYYPYNPESKAKGKAEVYGMTFIYEGYVRAHWLDLFELIGWREAPDDWQDYVILRRR